MVITRGKFIMAGLSKCQLCALFPLIFLCSRVSWCSIFSFHRSDQWSQCPLLCLGTPIWSFLTTRRVQKNICFAFVSCKDLVLIHLQTSADDGRRWLSLVTTVWCEAQTHTAYTNMIYNIIPLFIKCKWFCSRLTHLLWFKRLDT